MEYIHIKNLEKYHPGYKDRNLIWCKTYFTMINADPEFELLEEIDKWRFIAFVMLEIQTKKPVLINEDWLTRKGFNFKKRPIHKTLQMLHNFLDTVTELSTLRSVEVDKEVDKERKYVTEFFDYFLLKTKKNLKLTPERRAIVTKRLSEGRTLDELKLAVDNFVQDDWQDRYKFIDIVYCIGVRNKVDLLDKWLNIKPKLKSQSPDTTPEWIKDLSKTIGNEKK